MISVTRKNLEKHLNAIVGDRSPHTAPDHLKKVADYGSKLKLKIDTEGEKL